jgi:voltage-gated potassium channel
MTAEGNRRPGRLRRVFLRAVVPLVAAIVVLGGGALAAVEADTARTFTGGLWWALSLMTTVGFTGPSPTTDAGRLVSAVIMIAGFVVLAITTAAIASLFVKEDEAPEQAREHAYDDEVLRLLRDIEQRLTALERHEQG